MLSRGMLRWPELAVLVYFAIAASLFAASVPVFEAPDEPFHLGYVDFLLERRELPNQLDESRRVFREGHQPPLFYALAAALTLPFRGGESVLVEIERNPNHELGGGGRRDVPYYLHPPPHPFPDTGSRAAFYALRALGIGLGLLNLLLVLRIARRFLPDDACWLAAALVATLPQFLFISGSINNDNLANLVATAVIVASFRVLERPESAREAVALGLLLGLGLCIKKTVLALLPPVVGILAWSLARGAAPRGRLLANAGAGAGAMLAVGGWVWLRNLQLYGDPLGSEVERTTLQFIVNEQSLLSPYFRYLFWKASGASFVGLFGWMQIQLPLASYAYWCLLLGAGVGMAGAAAWFRGARRAAVTLAAAFGLSSLAAVVHYNTTFPEPQGRFLFPVIAPVAAAAALGIERIVARLPGSPRLLRVALVAPLVAIDGVALLRIARFY
jgi:4-amino-4-deoxy-L-arabinose transferase-like glycosyltransferase